MSGHYSLLSSIKCNHCPGEKSQIYEVCAQETVLEPYVDISIKLHLFLIYDLCTILWTTHSDQQQGLVLYGSPDRQDSIYHDLCYTSHGAVARTRSVLKRTLVKLNISILK